MMMLLNRRLNQAAVYFTSWLPASIVSEVHVVFGSCRNILAGCVEFWSADDRSLLILADGWYISRGHVLGSGLTSARFEGIGKRRRTDVGRAFVPTAMKARKVRTVERVGGRIVLEGYVN